MGKRRSLMDAMGSSIDEIDNGGTFSGVKKLSQMIPVKDIGLDPEFQELFSLDDRMVDDVARSIEESGFDQTQPLVVWKEENILLDGHTRLAAAKKVGLFDVPVFFKSFADRSEAMYYALGLQLFRRNLSQQQMVLAAQKLIELGEASGKVRINEIKKSLTERLGVGGRTAAKIVAVARDENALEAVKSGEKTVNQAYEDMLDERNPERTVVHEASEAEADDLSAADDSESVEDESAVSEADSLESGDDGSGYEESADAGESDSGDESLGDFSMVGEGEADDAGDGNVESEEEVSEDRGGYSEPYVRNSTVSSQNENGAQKDGVAVRQERKERPSSDRLPEETDDSSVYAENDSEDREYVSGFEKGFWYVLAEISRPKPTTVVEILSWFAGRDAFKAASLRAFEVPDYDEEQIKNLKEEMRRMR